jgi:adenosylcobinamide kinase/adenosylcobinamide-phosphate guanylyltransferase
MSAARTVLVLGGARSGKSRHAEGLAAAHAGARVYVASAEAGDAEMAARIARHREQRGSDWVTVEAPLAVVEAIADHDRADTLIIFDCVTLWVSNLMAAGGDVEAEVGRLADLMPVLAGRLVIVSNEVGLGIVPDNALARAFRDEAGRANQMLAAAADEVVLTTAGLALKLK